MDETLRGIDDVSNMTEEEAIQTGITIANQILNSDIVSDFESDLGSDLDSDGEL